MNVCLFRCCEERSDAAIHRQEGWCGVLDCCAAFAMTLSGRIRMS